MIALASLLLLQTPDLAHFKDLIDRADKSEAAVPAALNALSEAAFKKGFDLKAYQKAVGDPEFVTSPRRLAVERARKGNLEVVGVTIGMWSRVRARNTKGAELAIPASLRLIERYDATPIFIGRSLVIVQTSVQDAGVRYGYRTTFLSSGEKRLGTTENIQGIWTFGDEPESHLVIKGSTVTLRTIDEPRSFFTSNPERLFRRTSVYDLSGPRPRLKRVSQADQELRKVDQWIVAALRATQPTKTQTVFRKQWGTERPMLEGNQLFFRDGGAEVVLDFGSRFRFVVSKGGQVSFLGASKRQDLPQ